MATPASTSDPTTAELAETLQTVLGHAIGLTAGAARVGVSSHTLQKAVSDCEIPAFKLGRDWQIWLRDLDAWAAGR